MSNDPWKHRSKGMVCGTCMWNVTKEPARRVLGPDPSADQSEPKPGLGRCRKRAPTMNGYPAVFENDWCGSHKLDENKL